MATREAAVAEAGRIYALAVARRDSLTAVQAAREAVCPGGPSVEALEARIAADRTKDAA